MFRQLCRAPHAGFSVPLGSAANLECRQGDQAVHQFIVRWVVAHPMGYLTICGFLYTVPYLVIGWGFYIQGLIIPLWATLFAAVLWNVIWTWARLRIAVPARRMDRQEAARYGARHISNAYGLDTPHNGANHSRVHGD